MLSGLARALGYVALAESSAEALRLLLLRRALGLFLAGMLARSVVLLLSGAASGTSFLAVGVVAVCVFILAWRPDARRLVAWGLALAGSLLSAYDVANGGRIELAIFATLGVCGLFLDGVALGFTLLGVFLGFEFAHLSLESLTLEERRSAWTMLPLSSLLLVTGMGWHLGWRQAQRLLTHAQEAMVHEASERARLIGIIFGDVGRTVDGLKQAVFSQDDADWSGAQSELKRLEHFTSNVKSLRGVLTQLQIDAPVGVTFSASILRANLWALLLLSSIGVGYHLVVVAQRPWWMSLLLVCSFGGGLAWLRGKVEAPPVLAALVGLAALPTIGHDIVRDWGTSITPTLVYASSTMLTMGLLRGPATAIVVFLLSSVAVVSSATAIGSSRGGVWPEASGLVLSYVMIATVCLQAIVRQRSVLRSLEAERSRLAADLNQRRRLMGALFHDIANPLMALAFTCELGAEGEACTSDLEHARRMLERLETLLREARGWLLDEPQGTPPSLPDLDVGELVSGVEDLFKEPLSRKRLRLVCDLERGLQLRGSRAALGDGVLSNLVSNAIKFSPPGGALELSAFRSGEFTCIEVKDRGPGVTAALRKRFESGSDLPSRPGTAGEPGQGLGLALVREHLIRMGGGLELIERQGGGLVARVRLKSA